MNHSIIFSLLLTTIITTYAMEKEKLNLSNEALKLHFNNLIQDTNKQQPDNKNNLKFTSSSLFIIQQNYNKPLNQSKPQTQTKPINHSKL